MDAIVDKNFGLPNPSLVPLNWPRHCVGSMDVALYCQRYKCTYGVGPPPVGTRCIVEASSS